jgi:23S rRNA G2445 N2-methylase RlmL
MSERDLLALARAPSFTPGRRDLPALVALLADASDADAARLQAALLRADAGPARDALDAAIKTARDDGALARLIAALGALGRKDDGARARVIELLADDGAPARARKAAAVALGKIGGDDARAALIAYWDRGELAPDARRAAAEALGKVGGDDAIARLRGTEAAGDKELARRRARALLMAERDASRGEASEVAMDAAPPRPLRVIARCRAGLEDLLADELRAAELAPRPAGRGEVALELDRPLATIWRARTLLGAGIVVPLKRAASFSAAIANALTNDETIALLGALTRGPIRWRLDFAEGGHRRAVVWETAREVAARRPSLVNDPTATTWDVVADERAARLELRPRRFDDARFAYRVRDVPAASHPTIAAALARVAGARADDVVWDPFTGSGVELIERARLGPCAKLVGSDLDPRALDAARANLAAAGVNAELVAADARVYAPPGVSLVITNPPLGRRLRGDAPALLEAFATHATAALARGGRLVWISPVPRRTEHVLGRALTLASRRAVDLGGFEAALERWDKPA